MKNKKILLINGHPDQESFNRALAEAYLRGAEKAGSSIKEIRIGELQFNPNLQFGYRKRTELEPDLLQAQQKIVWADHLVWCYPVWWGSVPALMKGFIDRVFLPGFAFKYRENSIWWNKFLKGKTARLICTMDQPNWYYRLRYGSPSHKAMKQLTLQFVGIHKVKITAIGSIRFSEEKYREKWLKKIEKMGRLNR